VMAAVQGRPLAKIPKGWSQPLVQDQKHSWKTSGIEDVNPSIICAPTQEVGTPATTSSTQTKLRAPFHRREPVLDALDNRSQHFTAALPPC